MSGMGILNDLINFHLTRVFAFITNLIKVKDSINDLLLHSMRLYFNALSLI